MYIDNKTKSSTLPIEDRVPTALFVGFLSLILIVVGCICYHRHPGSFILVVIGLPFLIISIMTVVRDWKEWWK